MLKSKVIESTHKPIHIFTTQTRGKQILIYNVNNPLKKPTYQSVNNDSQNYPYINKVKLHVLGLRI